MDLHKAIIECLKSHGALNLLELARNLWEIRLVNALAWTEVDAGEAAQQHTPQVAFALQELIQERRVRLWKNSIHTDDHDNLSYEII